MIAYIIPKKQVVGLAPIFTQTELSAYILRLVFRNTYPANCASFYSKDHNLIF